jgi:hypothetical protein
MQVKPNANASLSFLVFSRDIPASVNLREQGVDFQGRDEAEFKGLISGFAGAHSKQAALVHAAAWTRAHSASSSGPNRILMLDTSYRISDGEDDNPTWLHLDRLTKDQRPKLMAKWMDWIEKSTPHGVRDRVESLSPAEIALRFPFLVARMIKGDKTIRGIVHQVKPAICPSDELWVATVRYEPKRFVEAAVRYLDKVKVKT